MHRAAAAAALAAGEDEDVADEGEEEEDERVLEAAVDEGGGAAAAAAALLQGMLCSGGWGGQGGGAAQPRGWLLVVGLLHLHPLLPRLRTERGIGEGAVEEAGAQARGRAVGPRRQRAGSLRGSGPRSSRWG